MPTKTKHAAKTVARKTGKKNIMDKVNHERGKSATPAPPTSAAEEPDKEPSKADVQEADLVRMAEEEISSADFGDAMVASIFRFPHRERELLKVIGDKISDKATTVSRGISDLHVSTHELDMIRSRWALIKKLFNDYPKFDDEIKLPAPLRKAMGDGLSYHIRELNKLGHKLELNLVKEDDIEEARELTQNIANKIGEQLVLFLKVEDGA